MKSRDQYGMEGTPVSTDGLEKDDCKSDQPNLQTPRQAQRLSPESCLPWPAHSCTHTVLTCNTH